MATERIEIVVTANGTRRVVRDLRDIGQESNTAASGVGRLKTALTGLAVGAGLRFLQQQADAYTNIQNRLRLVTTGTENLTAVNDRLFASANRTYSSYEATAKLYGDLARSSRTLGLSQEDLLGITESINQAIIISGTEASTAANGLRQLGQGLASGTLRGDELNSVLENMPRLAEAIATGMGVTIGQLRKLGAEGKISAAEITKALKGQGPVIAAEFARINPTISNTFTVLKNNVLQFIGQLNEASGVGAAFGQVILFVANHLQSLAIIAAGVGLAFAWSSAVGAISSVLGPVIALQRALGATSVTAALYSAAMKLAQGATRGLTAALLANPFIAILAAIVAVTVAIIEFGDEVKVTADGAVSLKDAFFGALSLIWDLVVTVAGAFLTAWDTTLGFVNGIFEGFGSSTYEVLMSILGYVKTVGNYTIGAFMSAVTIIKVAWGNFPGFMEMIFNMVINAAASAAEAVINSWQLAFRGVATLIGMVDADAGAAINGALNGLTVNIPRRQLSEAGQQAGAAIKDGVSSAMGRDYLGDFWDASVERGRALKNARGGAGGLNAADAAASTPGETGGSKKKPRGGRDGETRPEYLAKIAKESSDAIIQSRILDTELRKIQQEVDKVNDHLRDKKWAVLSPAEESALRTTLTLREQENKLAEVRDRILSDAREPQLEYERHLTASQQLLDAGMISQKQYTDAVLDARMAVLKGNTDMASGLERGILTVLKQTADEASRVESALTSVFNDIKGPELEAAARLQAINELRKKDLITAEEYARALRKVNTEMLQTKTDLASGLALGQLNVQADSENVAGRVASSYQDEWQNANGAMQDLQARAASLKQLMLDDPINSGVYAQRLREVGVQALIFKGNLPGASVFDGMRAGLAQFVADFKGMMPGLTQAWGTWIQKIGDGFANAVGRAIVYGENLGDSLRSVAQSAMAELISSLVKLGIQWLIMQVIGQTSMATIGATGIAMGGATAAAWAPAAAAVSLATFGANSAPAMAGIGATYGLTMALSKVGSAGFAEGGWTGNMGVGEVAGVVHGQEFVINAEATKAWRPILEAINSGATPGYSAGGYVQKHGVNPGSAISLGSGGAVDQGASNGNTSLNISIDARGAEAGVEDKIDDAIRGAVPYILAQASKQEDNKRNRSSGRQKIGSR